ncbi:unnamed protein product [Prorocentrum cordatum]|uniref:Uncharacterized protein n=1 Tax=Prorocentrum cordatum TaxID=2364126 RepID=A0ABN9W5S0_9DINO|nr:unnamed protein product [Polarella glacialis]
MPATPLRRRRRSLTGRPLRRVDCSRASAYPEGCDLYSRSAIQASSIHLDRPYTTPGRVHPGPKIWCIRPPGLANSRGPRRLGPSARAAPEARCHGESPRRDGTERNTFDPEHWYQLGSSTTLLQKTWKNLRIAQGACDGEGGGGGEGGRREGRRREGGGERRRTLKRPRRCKRRSRGAPGCPHVASRPRPSRSRRNWKRS